MAQSGIRKRVAIGVWYYNTALAGWQYDGEVLNSKGLTVWRWSNATENDFARPTPGGILVFENVPVDPNGFFKVTASNPRTPGSLTAQEMFGRLLPGPAMFYLIPDVARNTQTGPSAGTSVTGPGSSSTTTPSFKFSGSIGVVEGEAGSSNATTTTAPQTTATNTVPGATYTTEQVLHIALKRTTAIDGVVGLNMPAPRSTFG